MNLKSLFLLAAITGLAGCSAEQQAVETEAVIDALPDGAYLIAGVTVTENGEVSQYSRDQIKIYTQGRFMYAFNNAQTESIDVGAGDATHDIHEGQEVTVSCVPLGKRRRRVRRCAGFCPLLCSVLCFLLCSLLCAVFFALLFALRCA